MHPPTLNEKFPQWSAFQDDQEILTYLRSLPRYRNSTLKTAWRRAVFFFHVLYCRLTNTDRPLFMVLVTNNNCNLNCTYCYGEYGTKSSEKNYSTGKLLQLIDELKELGTLLLTVHGGEALLRKDIGEILNYAKHKGFYISLNTNGYLVPGRLQELRCLDAVVLSLDGIRENNDKHRGTGCFDKVLAAIHALKSIHMPTVLSATLSDATQGDMLFLADLAAEHKLRVQYSIFYNDQELAQKRGRLSTDGAIRKAAAEIKKLRSEGYPIYFSESVLDTTLYWPENLEKKREYTSQDLNGHVDKKHLIPCYHGRLKYQIDADGRVIRCWARNKPDAPNIHSLGLEKALAEVHKDADCKHCVYLTNNEHNALFDLSRKNILNVARIQLTDALKFLRTAGAQ